MTDPVSQPLTRRERELQRHRRAILDAAESLFAEQGYYATTMQMVADRAEFSVGYLYKHFDGKDAMYVAMVLEQVARLDEIAAEVEELGLPPLESLHRTYVRTTRHMNRHRDFMRIFHVGIDTEPEELLCTKRDHHRMIKAKLDAAVADGSLNPCDTELVAAAVQGATKELFIALAERTGENPFDGLADLLFSYLIDPLRN